jgi:hypothetical protein
MDIRPLMRLSNTLRVLWKHITLAAFLVLIAILVLPSANVNGMQGELRRAIAGALFATGTVSLLYDYLFVRRVIGGYFELVKAAASLELERIFNDRAQALDDIAAELQKANGSIKIMCVSGSDFFGEGKTAQAISDLIKEQYSVHLRFLLLKPESRYAFLRAWVEESYLGTQEDQRALDEGNIIPNWSESDFKDSKMQSRIHAAKAALHTMSTLLKPPTKLSVRFYRYQPSLFLVIVNRWVFVESYNWGVDRGYLPAPVGPCIAKRVLVLKFKRHSFDGMIFENHFDRLWRCSQTTKYLSVGNGPKQHADDASVATTADTSAVGDAVVNSIDQSTAVNSKNHSG